MLRGRANILQLDIEIWDLVLDPFGRAVKRHMDQLLAPLGCCAWWEYHREVLKKKKGAVKKKAEGLQSVLPFHYWEREDLKMEEQAARRWEDLPEECWELVFDRLKCHQDHRRYQHFESVSLVCKQFLSISNRLRSSLNIVVLSCFGTTLSVLFRRFRHLNRIDLDEFHGDLDLILTQLAQSGLNLEALNISNQKKIPVKGFKQLGGSNMKKSLKILNCSKLEVLLNKHLVVIGDSLPYLEELDISFPKQQNFRNYPPPPITEAGIVNLSSKLLNLKKINISGIHGIVNSSSLLAISSNCVFLTHITADNSFFFSQGGDIPSIIYNTRHLISLTVNGTRLLSFNAPPPNTIQSSLVSSKDLSVLDFCQMIISDEFLFSVREADFPLMKLSLSHCRGFTINGIDSFLCAYRSLKHLDLQGTDFLTDQSISDLSEYMHGLNFIGLDSCSRLTSSTFFTLARKCPCLQEIRMESTSLGKDGFPTELFLGKKNLAIRVLKFACNTHLNDKTLEKIGYVCPKLESLDVSRCLGITEHGIHEVGKRCSEVRELKMVGCKRICDFLVAHDSSEFSKLEVLDAMSSGISDGGLSRVGCNCIGLQRLVLECCFGVTEKGVIEVVKKCKRLRELNLKNCSMTIVASLSLIVFSRPSLRKVIRPGGFALDKNHKDLFLRHGCMVCDG